MNETDESELMDECDSCGKTVSADDLTECKYQYTEYYGAREWTETEWICKSCLKDHS